MEIPHLTRGKEFIEFSGHLYLYLKMVEWHIAYLCPFWKQIAIYHVQNA